MTEEKEMDQEVNEESEDFCADDLFNGDFSAGRVHKVPKKIIDMLDHPYDTILRDLFYNEDWLKRKGFKSS